MLGFFSTVKRAYSAFPATAFHPTIYALSTPQGQRSALAVIRITGSHSQYVYHRITRSLKHPIARRASLRALYDPQESRESLLDSSVVLFFQSPLSFTGEDMLELHVHGGKAVVSKVLKALEALNNPEHNINIRYAEAGEFSRRAFQNGRMDLTQIEGVGKLIDAETEMQRKSALSGSTGENKLLFEKWRTRILSNVAKITAIIDFGEDSEIEDIERVLSSVEGDISELAQEISAFLTRIERSSLVENGIRLALVGEPNAGKSSLLNCITNDETAIVSSIPGTTRDAIDVVLDIDGYKVVICDTAGIRDGSKDVIEVEGIKRAKLKGSQSDIVLLVLDASKKPLIKSSLLEYIKNEMRSKKVVIVLNKTDITDAESLQTIKNRILDKLFVGTTVIPVSCLTHSGVSELIAELTQEFKKLTMYEDGKVLVSVSSRVRAILKEDVIRGIHDFKTFYHVGDEVMASENLRMAADGIGKITGDAIGIEEILGVVFSSFCIGK
ncbi:LAMI_0C10792g1_1 [Lachancea mirantina]|uniref:LAMI_0C10792g1_1 n=1 Tax=Lachancea mirantina TaxID=1230905 RepID=A0A1G4J6E5_9SACH|nr:LAMI_0C10792g1_1 [Lachancea mirantina]